MIQFLKKLLWKDLKIKRSDIIELISFSLIISIGILVVGFLLDEFEISILLCLLVLSIYGGLYHTHRKNEKAIQHSQQKNQTLFSIYDTLKPDIPLPLMTGWAAEPELIYTILKEIAFHQPQAIFEIGSGSSTIISSLFLKQLGKGKVISIDHDDRYFDQNKRELQRYGVDNIARLHYAPIKKQHVGGKEFLWYDLENIEIDHKIDMVIVDGPPFKLNEYARYPAVPLLYEYLSDHAIIILDDAHRKDEAQIIKRWSEEYPDLSFEFVGSEKGIGILRKG